MQIDKARLFDVLAGAAFASLIFVSLLLALALYLGARVARWGYAIARRHRNFSSKVANGEVVLQATVGTPEPKLYELPAPAPRLQPVEEEAHEEKVRSYG
jgi:hypothetical protein